MLARTFLGCLKTLNVQSGRSGGMLQDYHEWGTASSTETDHWGKPKPSADVGVESFRRSPTRRAVRNREKAGQASYVESCCSGPAAILKRVGILMNGASGECLRLLLFPAVIQFGRMLQGLEHNTILFGFLVQCV